MVTGECAHCGARKEVINGKVVKHDRVVHMAKKAGGTQTMKCSGSGKSPMPEK